MMKRRPTLLVVDDEVTNIDILVETLGEDYVVRVDTDGAAALNSVKESLPDLILLDVMMPGMDGFEVCRRLKEYPTTRDIPIIFFTALNDDLGEARGLELGAVDYITKPFNPTIVKARVHNHLELKAHRDHLTELVAERTMDLAKANGRLLELGRIKDDFLEMIFHELRTPANGILGIGELIIDLCPASEECDRYRYHFNSSSLRLLNLIEDATMIANLEKTPPKSGAEISFSVLLDEARASLAEIPIRWNQPVFSEPVLLRGDRTLLKRALETMILLASAFSRNNHAVQVTGAVEEKFLRVQIVCNDLSLSEEQAANFFDICSSTRASSKAETLGLSPVVAHKIISAFGGTMKLVKVEGNAGYLEARLIREQDIIIKKMCKDP